MVAFPLRWFRRRRRLCSPHAPGHLLLQWHITERCNGRCLHCYQESNSVSSDIDFESLAGILDQFLALLDDCDRRRGFGKMRGHINLTGGEPFIRDDCLDLLDLLVAHRDRISFGILTNGTMIDDRLARFLGYLRPLFVQVSLDGTAETHDHLRGPGNFDKVCAAVRCLVNRRIPVIISFTANGKNFRQFPLVARIGRKLGVRVVWTDRFIPLGQSEGLRNLSMSPEQTDDYVHLIASSVPSALSRLWSGTHVGHHRALQFLHGGGVPYHCTASSTLLTVMSNGDLVPCRRLPIVVGNVLEQNLTDLYWNSNLLRFLRMRDIPITGCQECIHEKQCRGGLRCLSHAIHGDFSHADPGCWLAAENQGNRAKLERIASIL